MSRNEKAPRAIKKTTKKVRFSILINYHNGRNEIKTLPPRTTRRQADAKRAKIGAQANVNTATLIEKWED